MPSYNVPGISVLEMANTGVHSIAQVNTSIAGFVGIAPDPTGRPDEAVAINSFTEFAKWFIGNATEGTPLANAVAGFFANGGSRCYVVNVGRGGSITGTAKKPTGLDLFESIDDISIVAAPGFYDAIAYAALQQHCENPLRQDRVAILDTPPNIDDVDSLTRPAQAGGPAPASLPAHAATPAGEDTKDDKDDKDDQGAPSAIKPVSQPQGGGSPGVGAPASSYMALYYPWIRCQDAVTGLTVDQPPSGHMAGVWAGTDANRGVHKAPANVPILGAVGLVRQVSRAEQEKLNPEGVNCIRYFAGEGILVWGARLTAKDDVKYIPVRRTMNMIKRSIETQTRWIVFEPNNYTLWASISRDVRAFLTNVHRDGALFGRTPREAFFVKCDAETNPPEVRDAGQVVTIIGIAPVKPAEFVIFKLMQSAETSQIENLGA